MNLSSALIIKHSITETLIHTINIIFNEWKNMAIFSKFYLWSNFLKGWLKLWKWILVPVAFTLRSLCQDWGKVTSREKGNSDLLYSSIGHLYPAHALTGFLYRVNDAAVQVILHRRILIYLRERQEKQWIGNTSLLYC